MYTINHRMGSKKRQHVSIINGVQHGIEPRMEEHNPGWGVDVMMRRNDKPPICPSSEQDSEELSESEVVCLSCHPLLLKQESDV